METTSPEAPVPAGPAVPRLASRLLTALAALVLLGFAAWLAWLHALQPRTETVDAPEAALALVVGRGMELDGGLAAARAWERRLHRLLTTDGSDDLHQAIAWFEELADHSLEPGVDLRLAVLYGEAGDRGRVGRMTDEWESRGGVLAAVAPVVRAAYAGAGEPIDEELDRAAVAALLPEPWFADRLSLAWARRAGDQALAAEASADLAARGRAMLWRARALAALNVVVVGAGTLGLVLVWRRRCRLGALAVGQAVLPPPWSGADGATVLIRGGAAGALVIVGLTVVAALAAPWVDFQHPVIDAATWPLMYVPIMVLARRRLLAPAGLGLGHGLGLIPIAGGARRLLPVVGALLAAAGLGLWLVSLASGRAQLTSHWSEWFDPQLAWGDATAVVASLVSAVVLAPVFEEIVFRGLLFATLRRRLGLAASAVLSAAIFSVAHGYGTVGFVDVFWSGLLWAWAYERTGSLLPAIGAHALTNLLVSAGVLGLLR